MSATRYKRSHADIFMCIEMGRERNLGIKKTPGIPFLDFEFKINQNDEVLNKQGIYTTLAVQCTVLSTLTYSTPPIVLIYLI